MITAITASSSFPKPSIPRWNYHVFLSFRGEDTRTNFTAHLYAALKRAGIVTFKDDDELDRGDVISDALLKAIEESMFAIVVLSENYAESSWCLDELHKILESRQDLDQTVFPVFYKVDPSDIRHQKGSFMESAFEKHKTKFTEEKMQSWRRALTEVANIAGWDTRNKDEEKITDEIVKAIWSKLRVKLQPNFDHLVGIQSKVDKLVSLLKIELECKCIVGIWGMGGIGKTTLARVVYDAIQSKFEHKWFLANVREKWKSTDSGLVSLQKELLSRLLLRDNIKIYDSYEGAKTIRNLLGNKKVLIVLDDVSHIDQLKSLAASKEWFGDGSKIIITTRDIHLLREYDESEEYCMETLERQESFKLLCQTTFKKDVPEEGFLELSWQVVDYAGGLPLALEVLGSYLRKKSQSQWKFAVDDMKKNLSDDIFKTLRISYDSLEDKLKKIFLDIACFFNWEEKVEVTRILERCGRYAENGIKDLIDKSLLKCHRPRPDMIEHFSQIGKEFLYMHDLLQEMGRNIVTQESSDDISRQSRLWSQEQIDLVLKGNKGTRKVQSIYLNSQWQYKTNWHSDCFSTLRNVILLCLSNVHLSHSLNSLPSALKVFIWERCSLEALPHNIDQLYELVDLRLRHSKIKLLWNGTPFLGKLKFIDLSHSEDLNEMPNFEGIQNLESLLLEGCISLVRVHESLGQLKKLVKLNMKDCKNLVILPTKLEMDSLKELILSGCSKLEKLPEFGEDMKSLCICDLSETNVKEVPSSIVHLTNMKELSLRGSKGLVSNSSWGLSRLFWFMKRPISKRLRLPSFSGLSSLKKLDLSDCNLCDGSIPDDLSGLSSLMDLDLSGNVFASLPTDCISNLPNLEYFYLSYCPKLQSMPQLPPNLLKVDATHCPSMEAPLDLQNLFASLVSKHRSLLLYEDIVLQISGDEIPSWFEQREYEFYKNNRNRATALITLNIPYVRDNREWSGIAVCLLLKHRLPAPSKQSGFDDIYWCFMAAEDDNPHGFRYERVIKYSYAKPQLYITFFPFNSFNCWRHLSGGRGHLKLLIVSDIPDQSFQRSWESVKGSFEIMDCGWRLICKKDFEAYSASNGSSSLQIIELQNDK